MPRNLMEYTLGIGGTILRNGYYFGHKFTLTKFSRMDRDRSILSCQTLRNTFFVIICQICQWRLVNDGHFQLILRAALKM